MRLLHSSSLMFEDFHDEQIPPYLILSHTWGDDEVSYKDMQLLQQLGALPPDLKTNKAVVVALAVASGLSYSPTVSDTIRARVGYGKITRTAEIAREQKLEYFWIDTCCIDKSSSAELQEAINSMFRWYQKSNLCIVFLDDMCTSNALANASVLTHLENSRWITRGWTLQELIAPSVVAFYDRRWIYRSKKHDILYGLSKLTGIPGDILRTGNMSRASVAQKMSWTATRVTTRMEDRAYSLMGIFNVHMPMLYGEGGGAFRRLQEEIIRTTPDDSIFAWRASEGSLSHCRGLLAKSPREFRDSNNVEQGRGNFKISNLGLCIDTPCAADFSEDLGEDKGFVYHCMLQAAEGPRRIFLKLRLLQLNQYTRVSADTFGTWDKALYAAQTLYIEHEPQIPKSLWSAQMSCFHLVRRAGDKQVPIYSIQRVWPEASFDAHHQELQLSNRISNGTSGDDNSERDYNISLIWLRREWPSPRSYLFDVMLLLGYDKQTHRVWCDTSYPGHVSNHYIDPATKVQALRTLLPSFGNVDQCKAHARFEPPLPADTEFVVEISSGSSRGRLAYIVEIDGFEIETQTC